MQHQNETAPRITSDVRDLMRVLDVTPPRNSHQERVCTLLRQEIQKRCSAQARAMTSTQILEWLTSAGSHDQDSVRAAAWGYITVLMERHPEAEEAVDHWWDDLVSAYMDEAEKSYERGPVDYLSTALTAHPSAQQ